MSQNNGRAKRSEKGLLTPDNCVVAFIDHQPQMLFGTSNFDRQSIINSTVALAKATRIFDVPVVLTTVETKSLSSRRPRSGANYTPTAAGLVHRWHMIVATLDTRTQVRALYWDGKPAAKDNGGGKPNKTSVFSIGESTVFRGRYLNGSVEEVALWNRAISATEVAAIYAAATGSGGSAAPSAGTAGSQGSALFPNTAKVQLEGANGPIPLKPEEKIAFLFASAVQGIESDCQFQLKRTCNMAEVLGGAAAANGQKTGHLKYDPPTDPNYTYTVGALDMAWDVHATPKKPGLMGFYIWSRGLGGATIAYNPSGAASAIDRQFNSTSVEGDSFQAQ